MKAGETEKMAAYDKRITMASCEGANCVKCERPRRDFVGHTGAAGTCRPIAILTASANIAD
jgi:hypothetical protein